MTVAAPGVTAYSPEGTPYSFDAGALCLELLTSGGPGELQRYEVLHAPDDLARWFGVSRLRLGPDDLRVTVDELRAAHRLRTALWQMARDAARGRHRSADAEECVNETAALVPLSPRIVADGTGGWRLPATGGQALSTLARDAVELFTGPLAGRIRECDAPDCSLVFVDTSRPGRRRWCAMESCGNRHKVRQLRAGRATPRHTGRTEPGR